MARWASSTALLARRIPSRSISSSVASRSPAVSLQQQQLSGSGTSTAATTGKTKKERTNGWTFDGGTDGRCHLQFCDAFFNQKYNAAGLA